MEWKKLLSTCKLAEEEPESNVFKDYPINSFEKDYNKIVSSAAFRRLQDKTQVFPLDKSDFVRTRLTHSIEVSTIARQLGIMISKNTTKYKPTDIDAEDAEGICSVLLCAGLLHDLGNPPFGHFGETVIREWFRTNLTTILYKTTPLRDILSEQMTRDLEHFEGNAQSLRILAKARLHSDVNLSAAVISALIKYPTDSLSFDKDSKDVKKHKPGYFLCEKNTIHAVSEMVGTVDESGAINRHPLAFLLEAADDIAYATADMEDAFKKGLFTLNDFIEFFRSGYDASRAEEIGNPDHYSHLLLQELIEKRNTEGAGTTSDSDVFKRWVTFARRWLMHVVVYRFSRSYDNIMCGSYSLDLFQNTYHEKSIKILKDAAKKFVYPSPGILKLELASQTILSFLLDKFVHAVLYFDCDDPNFAPSKADEKCLKIFSKNYIQDYHAAKTGEEANDLYLRLLMVTDYISGMTDTYARTLYRELCGIE